MIQPVVIPNASPFEPGGLINTVTTYPYSLSPNSLLDINAATDDLELIILPHQIIIQLLQGPSKAEVKLRLLNKNFDVILQKICFAMRKTIVSIGYQQKLIYKFIISLIPFLFEKVKNVECSYLMLSD